MHLVQNKLNCCVFEQNVHYFSVFSNFFSVIGNQTKSYVDRYTVWPTIDRYIDRYIERHIGSLFFLAKYRWSIGQVLAKYQQSIGKVSAKCWGSIGKLKTVPADTHLDWYIDWLLAECRPTIDWVSTECRPSVNRLLVDVSVDYWLTLDQYIDQHSGQDYLQ